VAAELLNNLIFAQPENVPARLLQANIFEQMGLPSQKAQVGGILTWPVHLN